MDSRKLALSIGAIAVALYGCDGSEMDPPDPDGVEFPERDRVCEAGAAHPCATTANAHTAAERTAEVGSEFENRTFTFIVNALELPSPTGGAAAGFNLDGIDSGPEGSAATDATCEQYWADYSSLNDPDHVGVDNALPGILDQLALVIPDLDVNATLAEQLESGDLLLLVRVTGVDSLSYDDSIQMQLLLGKLPEGATIQITDGVIAGGQTFEIEQELGTPVNGDIFDGRLRATASVISLNLNVMDLNIALPITNPELRFDIAENGLTNGVIGGVLSIDDLIAAALEIPQAREYCCSADPANCTDCPVAREIVGGLADIDPSSANPALCEAISVGITFEATTATF